MKLFVVLVAVAFVLYLPARAVAATFVDTGSVNLGSNNSCAGCTVHIHNDTTGGMRTTTTSSGLWSDTGFIGGDKYTLLADYAIGQCFYPNTNTKTHIQPNSVYNWPLLTISGTATMSGCPQF